MFATDDFKTSLPLLVASPCTEFDELLVENLGGCSICRYRVESGLHENTDRPLEKCMENFTSGLRRFFEENFGPVSHFDIVKENRNRLSRGYGFVTFKHSSDAQKALNASEEQLTVGSEFAQNLCEEPMERILRIYQAKESLRSRVHIFLQARNKSGFEQMEKCQDFTSNLIFQEVVEASQNANREPDFVKITNLPDEIFRIILCNLKNSADWASCRLVCKRWNTIIQDIERFKPSISLYGHCKPDTDLNEYLFATLKKYPKLKHLSYTLCDVTTSIMDELTIEIIGRCCPKIEDLSLYGYIMSLENFADLLPELKVLDLSNCTNIRDKNLSKFLKKARNLKHLDLGHQRYITGECFDHLFPGLEVISIEWGEIIDGILPKLAKNCGSSLKDLRIGKISQDALSVVWRSFPNLRTIELKLEDSYTVEDSFSRVFEALPRMEDLQHLWIYPSDYINDRGFINLIESHKELKDLILVSCHYLTDIGVSRIPEFCKNLESLDISYSKISDQSLDSLSRLKLLKSLSVIGSGVTNDGLRRFLAACSNLDFLDVNDCQKVTPEIFSVVFELKQGKTLNHRLEIGFRSECVKINALKDLEKVHELILKLQSKHVTDTSSGGVDAGRFHSTY